MQIHQLDPEVASSIRKELYVALSEKENCLIKRFDGDEKESRKRPDYQRDYTRILYSSAFRRLQGKMQLLSIEGTNFTRNRLTHSLEVSQIARSIADDIGYKREEIYVIEACSLAHDIGNPPFGHYGERVLDSIIRSKIGSDKMEGFEGNAQTMRVLTTLQSKRANTNGMNLTYRTLFGVAKYLRPYSEDQEKYLYHDDYEKLDNFRNLNNLPKRTLDVQIMDLSDEIAYAAHDLEDTLKNRIFTIDEFITAFVSNKKLLKRYSKEDIKRAEKTLTEYVDQTKNKLRNNKHEEYNSLFCKELGSLIIYELIRDLNVKDKELVFESKAALAEGLKIVTFECLNLSNEVKFYESKGEIILNGLFDFFYNNTNYLPIEFTCDKDMKDEIVRIRSVIDYISGMMDCYAIEIYEKIYGVDRFKTLGLINKVGE